MLSKNASKIFKLNKIPRPMIQNVFIRNFYFKVTDSGNN
jgi:hypothetical protein